MNETDVLIDSVCILNTQCVYSEHSKTLQYHVFMKTESDTLL